MAQHSRTAGPERFRRTPILPAASVLAAVVALAGCAETGTSDPFAAAAEAAAQAVDGELIREVVVELSADRYGGRAPGSDGDRMARAYIAEQLETVGFAPGAAGGGWQQPFELVSLTASQPRSWTFARDGDAVELAQGTEFIVASGVQADRASATDAELVFVGYGIEAPEYDWNDFKGQDLNGKMLVMLNNDPDWDPDLFSGETRLYYGRWTYKYESAARQGAVGAIIIHTVPSAGYPWQVVQSSWSGAQFELPAGDEPRIELAGWVTEPAAERLLAAAGFELEVLVEAAKQRDFEPVALGLTTSLSMPVAMTSTQTANVIGVLRGSDPELADEHVIYTAHHDHLGIGEPNPNSDPNDRIYNGARDNASGVGMLLAIGQAFTALETPPRRSIMLLFVGAEEQGLLGSEFFARNPTVPAGKMAANVNFDSGNIWGRTSDMAFIGLGKSSLDAVAQRVADYQDRELKPDEFPDQGLFYRSDQFNFAKIGVPAAYLDGGTEVIGQPAGWGTEQIERYTELNYHQPSDEYDETWTFDGMVQDAQFGFWAGLIVANADAMPRWNPGDEFEAAREAALAAADE